MYNVGFGDSFLVSFEYAQALPDGRKVRHMLIDLGTKSGADHGPTVLKVANYIQTHCGGANGRLDVIVLSHRHQDHMSGFGQAAIAQIIDGLNPGLIVQPWTEEPSLPANATSPAGPAVAGPAAAKPVGKGRKVAIGEESRRFLGRLNAREGIMARLSDAAKDGSANLGLEALAVLAAAGEATKNKEAVKNLRRWADADKGAYVYAGSPSRIESQIPGIDVTVLGPPTPDQWPAIAAEDPNHGDYWLKLRASMKRGGTIAPALRAGPRKLPSNVELVGPQRWIVDRLMDDESVSPLELVTQYDKFMNNTSVVLLIKAGDKRMLFPGDAQGESWDYWFDNQKSNQDELAKVDFYKVGHHGSRNATAKPLMALWSGATTKSRSIAALMSTKPNVYPHPGIVPHGTEVPRTTLVAALKKRMKGSFFESDKLTDQQPWVELECDLTSPSAQFTRVQISGQLP